MVPAPTVQSANMAKQMREFVEKFGVKNYFPVGAHGISHVLVAQEGLALPGTILTNADSHTCSSGALNCLARGMGGSEMTYILCTGKTWFMVGPTTQVNLLGELPERVYPRDVIHYIPGQYGDFAGRNLEWHGDGLSTIGMDGRLTMATVSAELSAEFSLFPYDSVLEEYLEGRAKAPYEPVYPDDDAIYDEVIDVDLSTLEPQVVRPGKVAFNSGAVAEVAGQRVDQAFIGSCANGRLSDFAIAAEIVKDKKVAPGTRFIVTPGSQAILKEAVRGRLCGDLDGRGRRGDQLDMRSVFRRAHGRARRRRGMHHRLHPELQGPHGKPVCRCVHGLAGDRGCVSDSRRDHRSTGRVGRGVDMNTVTGRVWKFGDDINTDLIIPGFAILLPREDQPQHCFSANRPGWVDEVQAGRCAVGRQELWRWFRACNRRCIRATRHHLCGGRVVQRSRSAQLHQRWLALAAMRGDPRRFQRR